MADASPRTRGARRCTNPQRSARLPAVLLVLTIIADGCGSRLAPIGAATATALPTPGLAAVVLIATLRSGHTASGNAASAEDSCAGAAEITIDPEPRPPQGYAAVFFEVAVRGCPPGTTITDLHINEIHQVPIGAPDPYPDIWIDSGIRQLVLVNGTETASAANLGVPVSRAEQVLARPSEFYLHIHTRNNPAGLTIGELRFR